MPAHASMNGAANARNRWPWIAAVLATAITPALVLASDPAMDPETPREDERIKTLMRGSVLYHRAACRVCHSYGATGKKGPSLVDDEWWHCDGTVEGIKRVIRTGVRLKEMKIRRSDEPMPPAAELKFTDADVDAVARYIHAIGRLPNADQFGERSDGRHASPSQEEMLLRGSVRYHTSDCVKCHYSGARGGSVHGGPSLVDGQWLHCDGSAQGITAVALNGIPEEKVKDKERRAAASSMPPAADLGLNEADVQLIAAYLHAIRQLD